MGFIAAAAGTTNEIKVTETLIVGVMMIAGLVGIAVSRFRLPYTVALVLVGLSLSLFGVFSQLSLTSDLILLVFLPPLLFEGAINMDLDDLLRRWLQVGLLAVIGTLVSAAAITGALVLVPGMPWELALVVAVMLAPTDPVSVLAIFKEHGVGSGLRTLMEGESIFNDAIAIVLYIIAIDLAFGDNPVTFGDVVTEFGTEVVVGTAAGLVVGFTVHRLMSTLDDHLVEITLSLVAAYGAYLVADRLHGSGVIAVVMSGLLIGNYGTRMSMSASSRVSLLDFWEVLAFLANSALFLLIGLVFDVNDVEGASLAAMIAAIVAMLAARLAFSFGLLAPFRRPPAQVPRAWLPAVFWGGLRGSIPIALVLGLTQRDFGDVNAVTVVFGVVVFSLVVQGLTYRPVLQRLGLTSTSDEITRYEQLLAESVALRSARQELGTMSATGEIVPTLFDDLQHDIDERLAATERELTSLAGDAEAVRDRQVMLAARRLVAAQKRALAEATRSGRIGERIARDKSRELDAVIEDGSQARQSGGDVDAVLFPDAGDPDTHDTDDAGDDGVSGETAGDNAVDGGTDGQPHERGDDRRTEGR